MNFGRLILAFLVSPLMTPLTFLVTVAYRGDVSAHPQAILVIFTIHTPIAYLVAAVLGIPAFLLFRRWGWNHALFYVLGGAIIGLITALVIFGLLTGWSVLPGDYGWCSVAGGLSALVFWTILFGIKAGETARHR
jgi:hypothetical protein